MLQKESVRYTHIYKIAYIDIPCMFLLWEVTHTFLTVFYHALGLGHHNLKNYTTAINYFTLALEKFEKGGYENNLSLYYYDRAQAYAENGNIIMALRDLKAARNFDYEYAYNNISKEDKYELLNLIEKSIKYLLILQLNYLK